jgi:hypothetical protein
VADATKTSSPSPAALLVSGLSGGELDATSNALGQATLEGLGNGPVRVEASWNGHQATAWTDATVEREILLAVAPAELRRGRVRLANGKAARATVRLMGRDGELLASVETDENGRYEIEHHRNASSICVEAAGSAPAVAAGGDVDLSEGEPHSGRIVGAGNGELELYGLMLAPDDDGMLPFRCRWPVAEDGAFAGRLPKGVKAWGLYDGLPVPLVKGEVALPERTTASGRVRRQDGSPAAHAVLLFRPLLDADFPVPLPGRKFTADEVGAFDAVEGFAKARYAVEVRAAGCATRVLPDVRPGEGAIEITLEPGYSVGGFVVDTGGLPLTDARIVAMSLPDAGGERPVMRGGTDARGSFRIEGLGGKLARLQVSADGYHPTTIDGVRDLQDLRVVLQPK